MPSNQVLTTLVNSNTKILLILKAPEGQKYVWGNNPIIWYDDTVPLYGEPQLVSTVRK